MKRADVFAQALALPEQERLDLAAELLASARKPAEIFELDTPEYAVEVKRRIDAIKRGETKTIPIDEALARIRARARR